MITAQERLVKKLELDEIEFCRLVDEIDNEMVRSHTDECEISLSRKPNHSINNRLYDYLTDKGYKVTVGDYTMHISCG